MYDGAHACRHMNESIQNTQRYNRWFRQTGALCSIFHLGHCLFRSECASIDSLSLFNGGKLSSVSTCWSLADKPVNMMSTFWRVCVCFGCCYSTAMCMFESSSLLAPRAPSQAPRTHKHKPTHTNTQTYTLVLNVSYDGNAHMLAYMFRLFVVTDMWAVERHVCIAFFYVAGRFFTHTATHTLASHLCLSIHFCNVWMCGLNTRFDRVNEFLNAFPIWAEVYFG